MEGGRCRRSRRSAPNGSPQTSRASCRPRISHIRPAPREIRQASQALSARRPADRLELSGATVCTTFPPCWPRAFSSAAWRESRRPRGGPSIRGITRSQAVRFRPVHAPMLRQLALLGAEDVIVDRDQVLAQNCSFGKLAPWPKASSASSTQDCSRGPSNRQASPYAPRPLAIMRHGAALTAS